MKKLCLLFSVLFIFLIVQSSQATLLDGWDFSTLSTGTANPTTISATVGTGTLDLSGFAATESTNFAGSTINLFDGGSTTAGQALTIANQSANGKSMVFSISMLGFEDLIITFAGRGTSTGFNSGIWSWSTDNITFTELSGVNTATTSTTYALKTADFSDITDIDNVSTVYLKYTLSGATSSSGNNRLDNIQFNATAVPEPSTMALAALGGVACLIVISRRRSNV